MTEFDIEEFRAAAETHSMEVVGPPVGSRIHYKTAPVWALSWI
jgi:hypothetical protein